MSERQPDRSSCVMRRTWGTVAIALPLLFVAGLVVAVLLEGTRGTAALRPGEPLPPSARATLPPFDLARLGGGRLRLTDYRGRVTLLNLWASWCGPCREELPALDSLAASLPESAFAFVTVSDDVAPDRAAAFAAEVELSAPVGLGRGRLRGRYYPLGLPATILLDREGRVVYRWSGWGGAAQLTAIREMAAKESGDGAARQDSAVVR